MTATAASKIHALIGERVHYYRFTHNQSLTPRAAVITGIGTLAGTVNLQVFYDFQLDAMNGGGPDTIMVGDVPLKRHPPAVNGEAWKEVCCLPPTNPVYENEIVPPPPAKDKAPKPSKPAAQERAGQTAKSD
jgi:hypothetical protein